MSEQLANLLGLMLAGFLAALTPSLVILATRAGRYLASRASLQLTQQQEQQLDWAVRTGVAAAEEAGQTWLSHAHNKGHAKLEHAKKVARELAPKATASLPDPQLTEVVQAGVSAMRASQPSMSLYPPSLRPGSMLSIPVQVMHADASDTPTTPMPRPPRVPVDVFTSSETLTRPDRPRGL